jgi:hypothetical protein
LIVTLMLAVALIVSGVSATGLTSGQFINSAAADGGD